MKLKTKIILISSISIAFIQGVSSFVSINSNSKKMIVEFEADSKRIISELNGSLPTPLWNYAFKEAKNIVGVKLKTPEFKGAVIKEIKSGKKVVGIEEVDNEIVDVDSSSNEKYLIYSNTIFYENKPVWAGEFYFSDETIKTAIQKNITYSIISSIILIIVLALIIAFLLDVLIFKALNETTSMMEDISRGEGDLTKKLKIKNRDEIGTLSDNFNVFVEKIREIISDVAKDTKVLTHSSKEFANTSNQIAIATKEISSQTSDVSSATDIASSRVNDVSEKTNFISCQVETVASAIEEMSSSLSEVSQNCIRQSDIVNEAEKDVNLSNEMMGQLKANALEISKISDVINDIADQTNLLALNATIEAASAGEAGKGFAVVAKEVKELAHRTASATKEIEQKIENMDSIVINTGTSIENIVNVIKEISNISISIASAVEEQSSTINEIAGSVSKTNTSTAEVNTNITATAENLIGISGNITKIDQGMLDTTNGVSSISANAESLSKLALNLDKLVNQFKY